MRLLYEKNNEGNYELAFHTNEKIKSIKLNNNSFSNSSLIIKNVGLNQHVEELEFDNGLAKIYLCRDINGTSIHYSLQRLEHENIKNDLLSRYAREFKPIFNLYDLQGHLTTKFRELSAFIYEPVLINN